MDHSHHTTFAVPGRRTKTGDFSLRHRLISSAVTVAMVVFATAVAATVGMAPQVFCLLFLSAVFGVFLRQCGWWVGQRTGAGTGVGIGLVAASLVLATGGGLWLTGGVLADKVRDASDEFDSAIDETREVLSRYPVAQSFLQGIPGVGEFLELPDDTSNANSSSSTSLGDSSGKSEEGLPLGELLSGDVASQAASAGGKALMGLMKLFATTFGVLTSVAVIFFVGLFLAVEPELYVNGVRQLLPEKHQEPFVSLMSRLGQTMWAWQVGRFATMLITGVGVWAVMSILGVPLPLLLGIFTALMVFIPNVGAVAAVALAVLLALPKGIGVIAAVVVAYTIFQLIEGYILTPLIQKRAVELPPALLISSQLILGMLLGFVGVMVATPLVAVAIVVVRAIVVEDQFDLFGRSAQHST